MVRRGRWVVLCAATVLALAGCGQQAAKAAPDFAGAEELPERLGEDGVTILVGDPDASTRVQLYEDPRCPVCEEFETVGGSGQLREEMLSRRVRTEYTLASFLDDRVGGTGSKKAVNALRAALEEGKFVEYHEVLYANQPEESVDGYTDAFLLELAGQVEGLRGPEFDTAVKTMKYRSFVTASEKAYERAGGPENPGGRGTPTAAINGKPIPADYNGLLFDAKAFENLLRDVHNDPQQWAEVDLGPS
ncbi:thioredoxin domain-containing protein [Streptomyces sp. NPDC032940]|uniref:DsbA family protein n=1 Tax=Streptomyces sp. NPDC032940 TaxID=3155366 RepID=UPI0033ED250E